MPETSRLLEVRNLRTSFFTDDGEVKAVDDVSFYLGKGEVIAIVGESGCGKSVTQLSLIQLIQSPPGKILGGQVLFDGDDLLRYGPTSREMRAVRGAGISMIFQEPMTSLNPVLTVGRQLSEVILVHENISGKAAWQRGIEALEAVGIPEPVERMRNYPFEMSGGMRQRVMIATAVACNSRLIIADEPTTALDVTTQAQVMELLLELVKSRDKSLIIVTHNLGLVSRYAQRVYVMYAGKIIESGTAEHILTAARHPYTIGLLHSMPKLEGDAEDDLIPIEGAPPSLIDLPLTCAFLPRCTSAQDVCRSMPFPAMRAVGRSGHYAACHLQPTDGSGSAASPNVAAR
jgi:oligopeptide/dipeptide ABC transporter ATP-binding protein